MPQFSRIFAPVSDALIAHMISQPLICEHLFDLGGEDLGFEPPPLGLLVVRVPEGWWRSYGEVRRLGPGLLDLSATRDSGGSPWLHLPWDDRPSLTEHAELRERFLWFAGVSPPAALVSWLSAAAEATGAPLAYYHREEHGDDLYDELAFLFAARGLESVMVRQTFLVDTDDYEECVALTREGRSTFAGSVFASVLGHLGSPSRIEYFPPEDRCDFNWEMCRVDPREHTRLPNR
jgi:hypothetical protein